MTIELNHRLRVSPSVLVNYNDHEAVLLDLRTESYYGLDDVATDMLRLLTESETVGDGLRMMRETYDVLPEVLEKDIEDFVGRMLELGLMEWE